MSPSDKVAKLEALLARVQRNASKPRLVPAVTPRRPSTVPPPRVVLDELDDADTDTTPLQASVRAAVAAKLPSVVPVAPVSERPAAGVSAESAAAARSPVPPEVEPAPISSARPSAGAGAVVEPELESMGEAGVEADILLTPPPESAPQPARISAQVGGLELDEQRDRVFTLGSDADRLPAGAELYAPDVELEEPFAGAALEVDDRPPPPQRATHSLSPAEIIEEPEGLEEERAAGEAAVSPAPQADIEVVEEVEVVEEEVAPSEPPPAAEAPLAEVSATESVAAVTAVVAEAADTGVSHLAIERTIASAASVATFVPRAPVSMPATFLEVLDASLALRP